MVKSTRNHIVLPHNANLGSIQPMSADHNEDFSEAAAHTAHIIRPCFSSWIAPCILVWKPPEKGLPQPPRFAVDYRGLNTVTAGDGYPISSVSNVLDALSGGKKFVKLDLASGYWQVLVSPAHVHKTAFVTHLGLYEFLRMPYGLQTALQTFQCIFNSVFADFLYQWLIIYIDDVIVWADTDHEALSRYELVFEWAAKFGIQFKPTKCVFFSQNLEIVSLCHSFRVGFLLSRVLTPFQLCLALIMCLVSNVFLAWLTTLGLCQIHGFSYETSSFTFVQGGPFCLDQCSDISRYNVVSSRLE